MFFPAFSFIWTQLFSRKFEQINQCSNVPVFLHEIHTEKLEAKEEASIEFGRDFSRRMFNIRKKVLMNLIIEENACGAFVQIKTMKI